MKKLMQIGLLRGLVFQIIWTGIGAGFVSGIRALMGLWVWRWDDVSFGFSEPAWVVGGVFGALAFLVGTRVMDDWFKSWKGEDIPDHVDDPPGIRRYFGPSLDHKVIGVQYTITAILLMGIGGVFALIFRTELAESGLQVLTRYFEVVDPGASADAIRVQALNLYNTLMSLHGILMIVSILLGIAGMMNYLVPLMIGAEDMAFPRLNAFSFWIAPPAAVILLSSLFLGGFDTGWTGYPPLSARAP
ncbi:MAG TPA: cbb3-type cytochrome c oxidase subunit I, partial [Anaerolineales bacterium]|nr:cbb3-type cytochrome c oxidase subunit I [Anaerolineales bacterium]